jgi:hypothetical protein
MSQENGTPCVCCGRVCSSRASEDVGRPRIGTGLLLRLAADCGTACSVVGRRGDASVPGASDFVQSAPTV